MPTKQEVVIPVYQGERLDQVLEQSQGVAWLQAQFGTRDDPDLLGETLSNLSGEAIDKIRVTTPDQEGRALNPERAVVFDSYGGGFHIGGDGWVSSYCGLSRGVFVKLATDAKK